MLAERGSAGVKSARKYADEALKLARELKSNALRAEALLLQARINRAKGQEQRAKGAFKEAISIFEKMKLPFELAQAYYYRAEGRGPGAEGEKYLTKAKEIFEKLGAWGWLEKARFLGRVV
jgi:tetratricopeptide (TPR) repeat protein